MRRYTTIHGLSDERRPIQGGHIRIGRKTRSRSGKEIPEKLDHFKFDPFDEDLTEQFHDLYGPQPKALPIMLPSHNREAVFPQAYKYWRSGKLWCEGNNKRARRRNFDTGQDLEIDCGEDCPYRIVKNPPAGETEEQKKERRCKPGGTLRVLLPELSTAHVFDIRAAKMSIIRINSSLELIEQVCGTIGMRMLTLQLVPATMNVAGKATVNYLLQLDVQQSLVELAAGRDAQTPLLGAMPPVEEVEEDEDPSELSELVDTLYGVDPEPPEEPVDDLYARCIVLINQLPKDQRAVTKEELDQIDFNVEQLQELISELEQRIQSSGSNNAIGPET